MLEQTVLHLLHINCLTEHEIIYENRAGLKVGFMWYKYMEQIICI